MRWAGSLRSGAADAGMRGRKTDVGIRIRRAVGKGEATFGELIGYLVVEQPHLKLDLGLIVRGAIVLRYGP